MKTKQPRFRGTAVDLVLDVLLATRSFRELAAGIGDGNLVDQRREPLPPFAAGAANQKRGLEAAVHLTQPFQNFLERALVKEKRRADAGRPVSAKRAKPHIEQICPWSHPDACASAATARQESG